jgi:aminoglycoside 6'-N-acetyltransferase I
VTVRDIIETDRVDWVRLRNALWPDSLSDHEVETRKHFDNRSTTLLVFVAEVEGPIVGFVEMDFRPYAPGCATSPVPFIEGWYVEPAWQRRGIGRALIEAAEARAREMGYLGAVQVVTGEFEFPDRVYGDELVPAGVYRAVRVILGEGQGHNWWCVVYPSMCLPDDMPPGTEVTFYSSIGEWLSNLFGWGKAGAAT